MTTVPKNIIGNSEGDALKILEQQGYTVHINDPSTNRSASSVAGEKNIVLNVSNFVVKSVSFV